PLDTAARRPERPPPAGGPRPARRHGRRAPRARALLIGGSLNQTTMMHRVGEALAAHGCAVAYTPFYADGLVGRAAARGWLDFSILGGAARRRTLDYLAAHALPTDVGGRAGGYDLVVVGTDLYLPAN